MVKKLQSKLGLKPDGVFGSGTEMAVKVWQSSKGLTADGIVGAGTWSKMFGTSTQETTIVKEDKIVAPVISSPSVGGLKIDKLRGHIPDSVIAQIPDTAAKFNITNNLRLAHFLAQCGHESGGFRATQENLNYSADGLQKIFGKYFPGNLEESYSRNPEKIANRVYASRMGNGAEASGDGWKFRGRGALQLTGKENYKAFSDYLKKPEIMTNPDLVATGSWALVNNKEDLKITIGASSITYNLFLVTENALTIDETDASGIVVTYNRYLYVH